MTNTTKGVVWSAIERFSVQGTAFFLSLIIARLVTPSEFGLIAMLTIFMAVAQSFIDSGFGNALIQKKDRNEIDYSTVFYFNIVVSIIIYCILFICAPLIAKFYDQPILISVTRWLGLNLIIISFSIVQRAKLTIELNFKLQAKVSLTAVIISGITGIVLAYKGLGVWALVAQSLTNNLFSSILFWFAAKWIPLLEFSITSFKRLFSFGSKLLASGLLHTIYLNLYSLVIGKFYNSADAGYYNRSYTISQYPSTNIMMIISRAIYPIQCAHQDDDKWLQNTFVNYIRLACFIIFPLMTLLAILAKPLVVILLTDKWLPAAKLISILSLAYMVNPIMVINNQILNVKGRSDLFFKAEIIKKVIAVIIMCITLPFGLIWLCIGVSIYNLIDIILIIYFAKKVIKTGFIEQFVIVSPILILSLICGAVSYIPNAFISSNYILLVIQSFCFVILFLLGW